MADINLSLQGNSKHGATVNKPLRIDMTPMVDLGFLLITFFIFNAVLSKPTTMNLLLPKQGPSTPVPASKTLTLLLHAGKAVCYEGLVQNPDEANVVNLNSGEHALRNLITNKQQSLKEDFGLTASLMVIIKPGTQSNYQQLVAVLDEMTICEVKKYAIADMHEADEKLLSLIH